MTWSKWGYLESEFPRLAGDHGKLTLAILRAERNHPDKARQFAVFRQHFRLYPGEDPDAVMPFSQLAPRFRISISRASQMCRSVARFLRRHPEFWE